ncbi:MAG: KamA family radical SAM protein [Nitrospirota bacterium]
MNLPSGTKDDPPNHLSTSLKFGCGESNKLLMHSLWPDVTPEKWADWKWQMANTLKSIEPLAVMLNLKQHQVARYKRLIDIYRYAITPYYFSIINWFDTEDPVRKQCVPDLKELEVRIVGNNDPLDEEKDMPVPGLVHRYPDRVLAVVTNMCSMYCRHCTRKRIWEGGEEGAVTPSELAAMVHYIRKSPEVREVVVSGGDPLTMNLDLLDWFLGELGLISHVEVIRIGTRVPVVLPMKVTDDLVSMLATHRPLWVNTQFNHPKEITPESQAACDRILRAGIPVSNQTVLLRGINDSPEVMKALCHGLQRIMVRPYYLFQCDPVRGVEHFRTSIWKGIEIIEKMRGHTGGLCIPQFVVDAPGGGGKVPLQPFYLLSASDREVQLRNYEGMIIKYFNPQETDIPAFRKTGGNGRDEMDLRGLNEQAVPSVPKETSRYRRRIKKNLVPLYKGDA